MCVDSVFLDDSSAVHDTDKARILVADESHGKSSATL